MKNNFRDWSLSGRGLGSHLIALSDEVASLFHSCSENGRIAVILIICGFNIRCHPAKTDVAGCHTILFLLAGNLLGQHGAAPRDWTRSCSRLTKPLVF